MKKFLSITALLFLLTLGIIWADGQMTANQGNPGSKAWPVVATIALTPLPGATVQQVANASPTPQLNVGAVLLNQFTQVPAATSQIVANASATPQINTNAFLQNQFTQVPQFTQPPAFPTYQLVVLTQTPVPQFTQVPYPTPPTWTIPNPLGVVPASTATWTIGGNIGFSATPAINNYPAEVTGTWANVTASGNALTLIGPIMYHSFSMAMSTVGGSGSVLASIYASPSTTYSAYSLIGSTVMSGSSASSTLNISYTDAFDYSVSLTVGASTTVSGQAWLSNNYWPKNVSVTFNATPDINEYPKETTGTFANIHTTGSFITIGGPILYNSFTCAVSNVGGTGAVTAVVFDSAVTTYNGWTSIGTFSWSGSAATSSFYAPYTNSMAYMVSISGIGASTTFSGEGVASNNDWPANATSSPTPTPNAAADNYPRDTDLAAHTPLAGSKSDLDYLATAVIPTPTFTQTPQIVFFTITYSTQSQTPTPAMTPASGKKTDMFIASVTQNSAVNTQFRAAQNLNVIHRWNPRNTGADEILNTLFADQSGSTTWGFVPPPDASVTIQVNGWWSIHP